MRIPVVPLILALTAGGIVAGAPYPAVAESKPVVTVGPGADGGCVGDTSTPVCTVETWLACQALIDPELCARAAPQLNMRFHPKAKPQVSKYQISDVLTLTRARLTKELLNFRAEPGDAEIRLRRHTCVYEGGNCSVDSTRKESYFLGRKDGHWIILAWTDEDAPETCGLIYDTDPYYRWCHFFIYTAEEPWVHDRKVDSRME